MRQCKKCKKLKPLSFFPFYNGYYEWTCKECKHKKSEEWARSKRLDAKERYGISVATIKRYGLKLALAVYDKCSRKCVECEETNDLTIHHIDNHGRHDEERGLTPNHSIDNLVILCRKCHGSIHGKQSLGKPKIGRGGKRDEKGRYCG